MAQGLRQISGRGWLIQCQVWALWEEQAQALKPSLRECGCQLSITLTACGWTLILEEPAKARDEFQCAHACWSSCNWKGVVVSVLVSSGMSL